MLSCRINSARGMWIKTIARICNSHYTITIIFCKLRYNYSVLQTTVLTSRFGSMNGSSRLPRLEVLVVVSEMRSNATSAAIKPLLDELLHEKRAVRIDASRIDAIRPSTKILLRTRAAAQDTQQRRNPGSSSDKRIHGRCERPSGSCNSLDNRNPPMHDLTCRWGTSKSTRTCRGSRLCSLSSP